jgi:hypothetical protein
MKRCERHSGEYQSFEYSMDGTEYSDRLSVTIESEGVQHLDSWYPKSR